MDASRRDGLGQQWALPASLFVLTGATGLVDALSYLAMGHVFVANMTGNVVFLGFAIGGAHNLSVSASLLAIGAFLVGAAIGGRLGASLHEHRRSWLTIELSFQSALAAAGAVASGLGVVHAGDRTRLVVVALLALAMGSQNATARRLAVPDLTTTVLTMTLTGLAADSSLAAGANPHPLRRVLAVAVMLLGALVGAEIFFHAGFTTTLVVIAAVFASMTMGVATLVR